MYSCIDDRPPELTRFSRRGATLLELLTVIVVLMMITSATIPVVAPHAEGRRIREGARMLSTFINAGRTRAIETGRPAGIWIERMPNLPEAAVMVYLAEIPPVYSGDFLDSKVECCVIGKQTQTTTWPTPNNQEYYNIVIPRNRTAYQTDVWSSPPNDPMSVGTHQLVRAGDLIRFEDIDRYYNLNVVNNFTVPNSNQTSWWYIAKGINADSPTAAYNNDIDLYGRYEISWFSSPSGGSMSWYSIQRTTSNPFKFTSPGLRYQIFRQPVRLQAGSIRMPEGVVIDLNFSSVTNGNITDVGVPFHPRNGKRADDPKERSLFNGNAFYPEDTTPIVFVFSPDGRMQRLFRQKEDSGDRWGWGSTEPFGNVFLLVGERRCVIPHETATTYAEQVKKNWMNPSALWVRVNCQTGFTATALIDNLTTTTAARDPAVHLDATRGKARAARTVGGR